MKKPLILIIALLFSSTLLGFSLFELENNLDGIRPGTLVSAAGARYRGMGGAGAALTDSIYYNSQNPASFAKDQNGNGYLFYPGPDGPIPSIR